MSMTVVNETEEGLWGLRQWRRAPKLKIYIYIQK